MSRKNERQWLGPTAYLYTCFSVIHDSRREPTCTHIDIYGGEIDTYLCCCIYRYVYVIYLLTYSPMHKYSGLCSLHLRVALAYTAIQHQICGVDPVHIYIYIYTYVSAWISIRALDYFLRSKESLKEETGNNARRHQEENVDPAVHDQAACCCFVFLSHLLLLLPHEQNVVVVQL